jgi:hypothetical protein
MTFFASRDRYAAYNGVSPKRPSSSAGATGTASPIAATARCNHAMHLVADAIH